MDLNNRLGGGGGSGLGNNHYVHSSSGVCHMCYAATVCLVSTQVLSVVFATNICEVTFNNGV